MKIKRAPRSGGNPEVSNFIEQVEKAPDHELAALLSTVQEWEWPRTDLQYWIKALNRFDEILETVCRDYNLANKEVQLNEFTPKTKALLLSILRFLKVLLEHATNKRVFSSSDRLGDLLLTRDLDVLEANLRLSLRLATNNRRLETVSQERLLQLAQSWQTREAGLSPLDLARDDTVIPNDVQNLHFQYYNEVGLVPSGAAKPAVPVVASASTQTASASISTPHSAKSKGGLASGTQPAQSQEGLVVINLDRQLLQSKSAFDVFSDIVEQYSVPAKLQLSLFHKIRTTQAITNPEERRTLLVLRYLALGTLGSATGDSLLTSRIFVHEPDLIAQVAEMIQANSETPAKPMVDITIRSAALYALEGLCKAKTRTAEVFSAVNVSVNHGILMGLVRKMIADLPSTAYNREIDDYVDALFTLLTTILSSQPGSTSLINAGITPLLVDLIKNASKECMPVVLRAAAFLDVSSYGLPSGTTAFLSAGGINVYVDRIKSLVDTSVEQIGSGKNVGYLDSLLLKALFRSITRIMATSGTQGEGLRNLIDTSLPASIKSVMQHQESFGAQIYSLALNVMTTFIHNEPTSLSVIQEQGLPEVFFSSVEKHIEPSVDVFSALPNAIGALCLGDSGREQLVKRGVLPKLFEVFTSQPHSKLLGERENAALYGAAIDELIRHHPTLKDAVMQAIVKMLQTVLELGKDYEPSSVKEQKLVITASDKIASESAASATNQDTLMTTVVDSLSTETPATSTEAGDKDKSHKDRDKDNLILGYLDVIARFLEGVLQNQSHCKEFIRSHRGLELLCDALSLPCIPGHFHESPNAPAITTLFRILGEIVPNSVLITVVQRTRSALDATKFLWEDQETRTGSRLSEEMEIADDERLMVANTRLRALITLRTFVGILDQVFPHVAYSNHRGVVNSALQALNGNASFYASALPAVSTPPNILEDIGRLQRHCLRENIVLKNLVLEHSAIVSKEQTQALMNPAAQQSPVLPLHTRLGPNEPPILEVAATSQATSDQTAAQKNVHVCKDLVSHISVTLQNFFTNIISRPPPRRAPDSPHRKESAAVAAKIGRILADHLNIPIPYASLTEAAYAIVMMKTVMSLLDKGANSSAPIDHCSSDAQRNGLQVLNAFWQSSLKSNKVWNASSQSTNNSMIWLLHPAFPKLVLRPARKTRMKLKRRFVFCKPSAACEWLSISWNALLLASYRKSTHLLEPNQARQK